MQCTKIYSTLNVIFNQKCSIQNDLKTTGLILYLTDSFTVIFLDGTTSSLSVVSNLMSITSMRKFSSGSL